ncbi:MAG TPA: BBP7 family outer membrane beta-barrel protein [Gemmataceae bacterium]|jgi:hypothetical protein|nr:BBP7 family outer membrane beta-barrel protein [Gemmataceae bacterium]
MKRVLLAAFAALLSSNSLVPAQTPPAPMPLGKGVPSAPATVVPPAPDAQPVSSAFVVADGPADASRIWGSSEYLLWWVKSARVPLVSSGDPAAAAAAGKAVGAIGTPGTVFLNSDHQNFDPLSGIRATFGMWLDPEARIGFEMSGFATGSSSTSFNVRSALNGPAIAIPAIGTPPTFPVNQEGSQPIAGAGFADGGVALNSMLRIWGAEANGVYGVSNSGTFKLNLLAGFRYIDLTERLDMTDQFSPFGPGIDFAFNDRFETRNQVFAGQLGAQTEMHFGQFFVNLTGKVLLGDNHESVDIQGNTTIATPGMPFPFPPPTKPLNVGGFFAQGTNIGHRSRDEFVAIPELRLQVGANLTQNLRVFAGYEFLYMGNVVRPGDQIDRTVNGTQGFGGTLVGQPRPAPMFNSSDFWMQGVSAGIQFTF